VIFVCFNVMIYIEFELDFLIEIYFLGKFSYLLVVWTRKLLLFVFSSIGFIVVNLHNLNTKQH